jgi:hypothetical protein
MRVRLCGLQLGLAVHGLTLIAERRTIERAITTLRPRPLTREELLAADGYADPIRAKQLVTALVTGLPPRYLATIDADQITPTTIAGYITPPQARPIAAGWYSAGGRLFATTAREHDHVSDDSVARSIQELRRTAGLQPIDIDERGRTFAQMLNVAFGGAEAVASSPDAEILKKLLTEPRFGIPADSLDPGALRRLSVARVIRCNRGRIQLSDAAAFSVYATAEPPHQNSTDTGWHEALARAGNPTDM